MPPRDEDRPPREEPVGPPDETLRVTPSERAAGDPVALPAVLGDFELGAFLGKGAMGRVHRATRRKTGAAAVIKLVAIDENPGLVQALRAEVARLAELNLPHVPKVLDTGVESGCVWFAQEFIDGVDLREVIRRRRDGESSFHVDFDDEPPTSDSERATPPGLGAEIDDLPRFMQWFRDLAWSLDAIHENGLLHRDIKPANIMLARGRVPYLIDFGLAIHAEESHLAAGKPAGTWPYMSPEQVSLGWSGLGPGSDIYSLAVTFHELLTGERVVKGRRREDIVDEILNRPVPRPSEVGAHIPRSLDAIFLRATAKRVEDRHRSGAELARDIEGWLRPTGIGRRLGNWCIDHRLATALAAALLLLVAAAIFFLRPDPLAGKRERLLEAGAAPERAAALLHEIANGFATDDELDRLASEVAEVVRVGAPGATAELIGETCFVLELPGLELPHVACARTAGALLARGHDDADFHFQLSFGSLMEGDLEEARVALDRGLEISSDAGSRARLLALGSAIAGAAGDGEASARFEARLVAARSTIGAIHDVHLLHCVEMLGLLFAPATEAANAALERGLEKLGFAFGSNCDRAARSLHARVLLRLGRPREALANIAALATGLAGDDSPHSKARRLGVRAYEALSYILVGLEGADDSGAHLDAGIRIARTLVADHAGVFDWLATFIVGPHLDSEEQRPEAWQVGALEFIAGCRPRGEPERAFEPAVHHLLSRASDVVAIEGGAARIARLAAAAPRFRTLADASRRADAERAWARHRDNLRYAILEELTGIDEAADPAALAAEIRALSDLVRRDEDELFAARPVPMMFIPVRDAMIALSPVGDETARGAALRGLEDLRARLLAHEEATASLLLPRVDHYLDELRKNP